MTVSEIIAVIFAIIVLAEFAVIMFVKPKKVLPYVKQMLLKPAWLTLGCLVAAVVVGIVLLRDLTIAQLMAGALFGILVYALALVQFPNMVSKMANTAFKDKTKLWLAWLVFIALSIWVLVAVF